jgi:integrase
MKTPHSPEPWNKGKLIGQKSPLKLKDIWAIRFHFQQGRCIRDLALFNLAIDSKLRGCDLVDLRLRDISHGNQIMSRAIVMQQKTKRPVQIEIAEQTREAVKAWVAKANLNSEQYLFPSRLRKSPHITTRQYARIVHKWVESIGPNPSD